MAVVYNLSPNVIWLRVICGHPLKRSDLMGGMALPRKSVESKKTMSGYYISGKHSPFKKCSEEGLLFQQLFPF